MIRHILRPTAMLILAIALCGSLAAPQSTMAQESPIDLLKYLEGLESAHARRYQSAESLNVMPLATPTTGRTPTSASRVEATVLEFSTEAEAETAFALALNDGLAREILGEPDIEFDESGAVDLGDQARIFVGARSDGEETVGLLAVRDGNLGFLVSAAGADDTIRQTLRDFGIYIVEAEPGTGAVTVDEFGMASGGTFDLMPSFDDEDVLNGLIPVHDYNLLFSNSPLEPSASPAP
jgi:hypothetical protein